MLMKTIIESYKDAVDCRSYLALYQMKDYHFLYRGHASNSFELLSMVGRKNPIDGKLMENEKKCFNEYKVIVKDKGWENFKIQSYHKDMFYMGIGRHLGLDCRLLDWTASLDTALYFASSDKKYESEDGHLWIMGYYGKIDDTNAKVNPFDIDDFALIKEYYLVPRNMSMDNLPLGELRRFAQNGFFSIVPSDMLTTPLDKMQMDTFKLIRVEITSDAKKDILNQLPESYSNFLYKGNSELETQIKQINSKYFA